MKNSVRVLIDLRLARIATAGAATMVLLACNAPTEKDINSAIAAQISRGEIPAAIIKLKASLKDTPNSAELRFLLGRASLEGGDPVAAQIEFGKALELGYSADSALPLLAKAMLLTGQARKLTENLGKTELQDGHAAADLLTVLAVAYAQLGDSESALSSVRRALERDPKYAPARILHARTLVGKRKFDDALAVLDDVLVTESDRAEALKLKGDIHLAYKANLEDATKAYEASITANPRYVPAHVSLIQLAMLQRDIVGAGRRLEKMKAALPRHWQTQYFEAEQAFIANDLARAKERVQLLMRNAPDNVQLLKLAGTIESDSGALVAAKGHLEKALKIAPDSVQVRVLLTQTYLRGGEVRKAQATIAPALQSASPPGAALALAAEVHLHAGDAAQAQVLFERAAKVMPNDARLQTALAVSKIAKGEEAKGVDELKTIAASSPETAADLALVSALLSMGRLDDALAAVQALEKKKPSLALAPLLHGRILLLKKDVEAAKRSFLRAVEIDKSSFLATASLGEIDVSENRPQDAKARFESLLALDPKNYQARLALVELNRRSGAKPAEIVAMLEDAVRQSSGEPSPRVALVDHLLATQDPKGALAAARAANSAIPGDSDLLDALGRAQLASGDAQQAIATFRTLAAAMPESPQPLLRLATAHAETKNRTAALQALRQALALAPNILSAKGAVVDLLVAEKRWAEAMNMAREGQVKHKDRPEGYLWEAQVHAAQSRWAPAVSSMRAALERGKNGPLAISMHRTLVSAGRAAEAEQFAVSWMTERKSDVVFLEYLGDAALKRGDWQTAERTYLIILQLNKNRIAALNNLAWALYKQQKPGASAYAARAVELDPNRPLLLDTLALALAAENRPAEALDIQKRAVELAPDTPELRLNLSRIAIQANQTSLAKAELEKLTWLGEKFAQQREVVTLLKLVQ